MASQLPEPKWRSERRIVRALDTSAGPRDSQLDDTEQRRPRRKPPPSAGSPTRHPKHRDRRPRRPRQDDAGRRHAPPERHLPRQRGGGRPGHGLERPRARARHHDPREEHRRRLRGREDQHRRHARPRRLRRRGGAHALDGRRRPAARRRLRGAAAADALRAEEGARARPARRGVHQQDRPPRRAHRRGAGRGLRSLHRPRRRRRSSSTSRSSTRTPAPASRCTRPTDTGTTLELLFDTIVERLPGPALRSRTRRRSSR